MVGWGSDSVFTSRDSACLGSSVPDMLLIIRDGVEADAGEPCWEGVVAMVVGDSTSADVVVHVLCGVPAAVAATDDAPAQRAETSKGGEL